MAQGIYVHSKACIYSLYLFTKQTKNNAPYRLLNKEEESLMFLEKICHRLSSAKRTNSPAQNFIEQKVPTKSSQMPKQQQWEQEKGTVFWELDWTQSQIKDQSQLTRPSVLPSLVFSPYNVMKLRQSIPTNLFIYPYQAAVCLCSLHGSFTLWETPNRDSLEVTSVCWNK